MRFSEMAIPTVTLALLAAPALAQDAPLFERPYNGVPVDRNEAFTRVVPEFLINSDNDLDRSLDPGGQVRPDLPPRFTESVLNPSTTMTVGAAYLGQFIDHDLTLTRTLFNEWLIEPFVFAALEIEGQFRNDRIPGLDLDPVYRIHPLNWPSSPGNLGPWELDNLRFRFTLNDAGARDFFRAPDDKAIIGDIRNDENGIVAQIHRAFMMLHNEQVMRIVERDNMVLEDIEYVSAEWHAVYNEARNYTTAYYQGIVMNDYLPQITGRTLIEAMNDRTYPMGPLADAQVPVEFSGAAFRLHTTIPPQIQIGPEFPDGGPVTSVSPIDPALANGVAWHLLFGPDAAPASKMDLGIAAPLRDIVDLFIPGSFIPITLDLAQVNILRGREMRCPSGEEYLAFLLDELGLDPETTSMIRGKQVLTANNAMRFLTLPDDDDLRADLISGDSDLFSYLHMEMELNDGVLGPVGQDIVERTFIELLLGDDWSLLGANADQFTAEQKDFFLSATFDRLLEEIRIPADLNQDTIVNAIDLAYLLSHWGEKRSIADIDGDGRVNATDLSLLLDSWGM